MSKVTMLEGEVKKLSDSELAEFREWHLRYDERCWERQIEADSNNGRLDDIAAGTMGEYKQGGTREL